MAHTAHHLGRKLGSRRGASITFALLLFLVCAVIGVIVLVAGSAASGRISKLVESDQRYYAVSSAAELLRQEIEGQSVIITRKAAVPVTKTTTTYDDGTIVIQYTEGDVPEDGYTRTCSGAISSLPFYQDAAQYCLFGAIPDGDGISKAMWDRAALSGQLSAPQDLETLTLTFTDAENDASEAVVEIRAQVDTSGQLLLYLSCSDYGVTLTFSPRDDRSERSDSLPTGSGAAPAGGTATQTRTDSMTIYRYKEDVFRWNYAGMTGGA